MDAKVFDFVKGDGLVFAWFGVGGDVLLWIRSEGSDVDFSRCNGSMWVDLTSHNQRGFNGISVGEDTTTATKGS
jgi:predicted nucleotidyltransferase